MSIFDILGQAGVVVDTESFQRTSDLLAQRRAERYRDFETPQETSRSRYRTHTESPPEPPREETEFTPVNIRTRELGLMRETRDVPLAPLSKVSIQPIFTDAAATGEPGAPVAAVEAAPVATAPKEPARVADTTTPAPAPAPVDVEPSGSEVDTSTYEVVPGDTFSKIIDKHFEGNNFTPDQKQRIVDHITHINGIDDPNKLAIGQELQLPDSPVVPDSVPSLDWEAIKAQYRQDREPAQPAPDAYTPPPAKPPSLG